VSVYHLLLLVPTNKLHVYCCPINILIFFISVLDAVICCCDTFGNIPDFAIFSNMAWDGIMIMQSRLTLKVKLVAERIFTNKLF